MSLAGSQRSFEKPKSQLQKQAYTGLVANLDGGESFHLETNRSESKIHALILEFLPLVCRPMLTKILIYFVRQTVGLLVIVSM